jgi:hypothetical protein
MWKLRRGEKKNDGTRPRYGNAVVLAFEGEKERLPSQIPREIPAAFFVLQRDIKPDAHSSWTYFAVFVSRKNIFRLKNEFYGGFRWRSRRDPGA